ncbi:putative dolichyl-phosphate beta-D-mannosyltransferase [Rosa chinensis]|uniref:Putative dolichyl-phosphate beta-D-mannosyltransferase n=1 Tax=Rosa chinensis TaxID=74649 RepID=A0A2P6PIN0_ROSCH|nr:putative dolichyl-phosphate beta-D-mannosyltransferase [Rosa chinensis]
MKHIEKNSDLVGDHLFLIGLLQTTIIPRGHTFVVPLGCYGLQMVEVYNS